MSPLHTHPNPNPSPNHNPNANPNPNQVEVQESDPSTGIRTNALYITTVDEMFPAMIRRVTYTNEGDDDVELEVLDGLSPEP